MNSHSNQSASMGARLLRNSVAHAWVLAGCSPDAQPTQGVVDIMSFRTPVPVVVEAGGERVVDSGTLFVSIRGDRGVYGGRRMPSAFWDSDSVPWIWATPVWIAAIDMSYSYPWTGRHELNVPETSTDTVREVVDRPVLCEEACTLRFYYTEQEFNGRDGQISDWERDHGDLLMWDEAPELWRYAELEYRFSDRVDVSYIESFDDETGRGVLQLGLVTFDVSGEDVVVEVRPHRVDVLDYRHPAIAPPRIPDVSEFPEETDAGSER